LIESAVESGISLVQLREKNLSARSLYQLTRRAARLTSQSSTGLLINDRADVARAAGADGVHLTSHSLEAGLIRNCFGDDFIIGVSTHSIAEARAARDQKADFAVFGPVFDTPSKRAFGVPVGTNRLRDASLALKPFPLVAIGGIAHENAALAFAAGASGVAAIRVFGNQENLKETLRAMQRGASLM